MDTLFVRVLFSSPSHRDEVLQKNFEAYMELTRGKNQFEREINSLGPDLKV